jgi:cytochrome c-type biogenesis protein CcsB
VLCIKVLIALDVIESCCIKRFAVRIIVVHTSGSFFNKKKVEVRGKNMHVFSPYYFLFIMTISLNWNGDTFLANFSFVLLFSTMLFYWVETAFFLKKTNKLGFIGMILSNFSLLTLLLFRWKESGHFPLSNLYESLMFLSWSFTSIHILLITFYFKEIEQLTYPFFVQKSQTEMPPPIKWDPQKQTLLNINIKSVPISSAIVTNSVEDQYFNDFPNNIRNNKENTSFIPMNRVDGSSLFGSITAPSALLTNAFANFSLPLEMQHSSALVPALQSNWLVMHVTIMILSYAALIAGCLLSIAFLVMSDHKVGQISLNNNENKTFLISKEETSNFAKLLDNLSYRLLGIGFPLLTIGILSGAVWANEAWGSYWSWDPKETWALLTWLVFAVYLHTRLTKGWQGRKPAIIASIGFVVVWVCFLGVNLIGKGLHSYGWIQNI